MPPTPNPYRDPGVLRRHVRAVLRTYYPECIDHRYGGYVLQFDEADGHCYDGRSKHLVATARAVHNFSVGVLIDGPDWCRSAAGHGLDFLDDGHWDADRGGYDWLLAGRETADADRYAYGHAFVVLAAARALDAGIPGAREELERAVGVLEERFRVDDGGDDPRYADQAAPDWSSVSDYRGQNANMHACEALLAAYEATGEDRYLERSVAVARAVTGLAEDGRLWEHYTAGWAPNYDRDAGLGDRFGPWGYQPGHHAEWAKLCCLLAEHREAPWLSERARQLFDRAAGWWLDDGGFPYTVDREDGVVDADVYGWPVAEAIGASAALAGLDDGGDGDYLEWYDRLWRFAEANLINPKYGTWYQRLTPDGERDPEGGVTIEPGYHPVSNALVAMEAFGGGD